MATPSSQDQPDIFVPGNEPTVPGTDSITPYWQRRLPYPIDNPADSLIEYGDMLPPVVLLNKGSDLQEFYTIKLCSGLPIYRAGDVIKGSLYLSGERLLSYEAINLHLRQTCYIDLTQSQSIPNQWKDTVVEQTLYRQTKEIWTADSKKNAERETGLQKYTFDFDIPKWAPASSLDPMAASVYTIYVEFLGTGLSDLDRWMFVSHIYILGPLDAEGPSAMIPLTASGTMDLDQETCMTEDKLNVKVCLSEEVITLYTPFSVDISVTGGGSGVNVTVYPVIEQQLVLNSDPKVSLQRNIVDMKDEAQCGVVRKKQPSTFIFRPQVGDVISTTLTHDHPDFAHLDVSYTLKVMVKVADKEPEAVICQVVTINSTGDDPNPTSIVRSVSRKSPRDDLGTNDKDRHSFGGQLPIKFPKTSTCAKKVDDKKIGCKLTNAKIKLFLFHHLVSLDVDPQKDGLLSDSLSKETDTSLINALDENRITSWKNLISKLNEHPDTTGTTQKEELAIRENTTPLRQSVKFQLREINLTLDLSLLKVAPKAETVSEKTFADSNTDGKNICEAFCDKSKLEFQVIHAKYFEHDYRALSDYGVPRIPGLSRNCYKGSLRKDKGPTRHLPSMLWLSKTTSCSNEPIIKSKHLGRHPLTLCNIHQIEPEQIETLYRQNIDILMNTTSNTDPEIERTRSINNENSNIKESVNETDRQTIETNAEEFPNIIPMTISDLSASNGNLSLPSPVDPSELNETLLIASSQTASSMTDLDGHRSPISVHVNNGQDKHHYHSKLNETFTASSQTASSVTDLDEHCSQILIRVNNGRDNHRLKPVSEIASCDTDRNPQSTAEERTEGMTLSPVGIDKTLPDATDFISTEKTPSQPQGKKSLGNDLDPNAGTDEQDFVKAEKQVCNKMHNDYKSVCRLAAKDEESFENFQTESCCPENIAESEIPDIVQSDSQSNGEGVNCGEISTSETTATETLSRTDKYHNQTRTENYTILPAIGGENETQLKTNDKKDVLLHNIPLKTAQSTVGLTKDFENHESIKLSNSNTFVETPIQPTEMEYKNSIDIKIKRRLNETVKRSLPAVSCKSSEDSKSFQEVSISKTQIKNLVDSGKSKSKKDFTSHKPGRDRDASRESSSQNSCSGSVKTVVTTSKSLEIFGSKRESERIRILKRFQTEQLNSSSQTDEIQASLYVDSKTEGENQKSNCACIQTKPSNRIQAGIEKCMSAQHNNSDDEGQAVDLISERPQKNIDSDRTISSQEATPAWVDFDISRDTSFKFAFDSILNKQNEKEQDDPKPKSDLKKIKIGDRLKILSGKRNKLPSDDTVNYLPSPRTFLSPPTNYQRQMAIAIRDILKSSNQNVRHAQRVSQECSPKSSKSAVKQNNKSASQEVTSSHKKMTTINSIEARADPSFGPSFDVVRKYTQRLIFEGSTHDGKSEKDKKKKETGQQAERPTLKQATPGLIDITKLNLSDKQLCKHFADKMSCANSRRFKAEQVIPKIKPRNIGGTEIENNEIDKNESGENKFGAIGEGKPNGTGTGGGPIGKKASQLSRPNSLSLQQNAQNNLNSLSNKLLWLKSQRSQKIAKINEQIPTELHYSTIDEIEGDNKQTRQVSTALKITPESVLCTPLEEVMAGHYQNLKWLPTPEIAPSDLVYRKFGSTPPNSQDVFGLVSSEKKLGWDSNNNYASSTDNSVTMNTGIFSQKKLKNIWSNTCDVLGDIEAVFRAPKMEGANVQPWPVLKKGVLNPQAPSFKYSSPVLTTDEPSTDTTPRDKLTKILAQKRQELIFYKQCLDRDPKEWQKLVLLESTEKHIALLEQQINTENLKRSRPRAEVAQTTGRGNRQRMSDSPPRGSSQGKHKLLNGHRKISPHNPPRHGFNPRYHGQQATHRRTHQQWQRQHHPGIDYRQKYSNLVRTPSPIYEPLWSHHTNYNMYGMQCVQLPDGAFAYQKARHSPSYY